MSFNSSCQIISCIRCQKHFVPLSLHDALALAFHRVSICTTGDPTVIDKWSAPEVVATTWPSSKLDVWAYGVLLAEILTFGTEPYPGQSDDEAFAMLSHGIRMSPISGCPTKVTKLMSQCWAGLPSERPSFVDCHEKLNALFKIPDEGSMPRAAPDEPNRTSQATATAVERLARIEPDRRVVS